MFSAKKAWVTVNQIIHVIFVHVIRQNIHLKIINKMKMTLTILGNSSIYLKIIIYKITFLTFETLNGYNYIFIIHGFQQGYCKADKAFPIMN